MPPVPNITVEGQRFQFHHSRGQTVRTAPAAQAAWAACLVCPIHPVRPARAIRDTRDICDICDTRDTCASRDRHAASPLPALSTPFIDCNTRGTLRHPLDDIFSKLPPK